MDIIDLASNFSWNNLKLYRKSRGTFTVILLGLLALCMSAVLFVIASTVLFSLGCIITEFVTVYNIRNIFDASPSLFFYGLGCITILVLVYIGKITAGLWMTGSRE
jgi:hypothetical protein